MPKKRWRTVSAVLWCDAYRTLFQRLPHLVDGKRQRLECDQRARIQVPVKAKKAGRKA